MGKNKIKILLQLGLRWMNGKWLRALSALVLSFFSFNLSAPSALIYYELVQVAQAQSIGTSTGPISSAISSIFGKTGDILQQFDTKQAAVDEKAAAANQTTFDLVAILVDEDVANNTASYDGLISSHNPTVPSTPSEAYRILAAHTLQDRVDRYAKDLQAIDQVSDPQPFVKTMIIKVKHGESTEDISAALQKLYLEGDGTANEKNRLKGIVIVGNVPLPVVNKNGNRFVSMFPYTDFEDPYYIYDPATKDFIVNPNNKIPGAEVWHGIIKPPVDGEEGNKLLAEYFDKNHLFKVGDPEYKDFAKKLFYSDFNKEFSLMGAEGLNGYAEYLKYWEDISYFRYNKNWAKKLYTDSSVGGQDEGDGVDNDGDGKIDEDPVNGYDDDGDGEDGSPLFGLINGKDDDGDGKIDNDEEGTWGFCHPVPPTGPTKLENCKVPGKPYKTGDYYNTLPGSIYKVADGVNNNPEVNQLIDEGIDEDPGDAFINVDNDRDGRVDEDTSSDNDADHDGKTDEDGPGDMNKDGCPGVCGVDEDNDSVDGDGDGYPDGYERDYGNLSLSLSGLQQLITSSNIKEAFGALQTPSDKKDFFDMPTIDFTPPIGPAIPFPRIFPFPDPKEWIDEGSKDDDDEDGKVDEDGTADNDNDKDGQTDEDPGDALGNKAKGDGGGIFDNLPDIRSKNIIDSFFKKYNELFDKFYSEANNWVDATGRYESTYNNSDGSKGTDLITFPLLIAAKDEFTRIYLKAVNDAVEYRVDNYVKELQYDINLVKGAELTGYVVLPDANGVFPPNQKIAIPEISFINFGYRNDAFFAGVESTMTLLATLDPSLVDAAKQTFLDSINGPVDPTTPIYINGKPIDSITNIQQCSLYRGSEGSGENSQMVTAGTVYDPSSNINPDPAPQMPKSWMSLPQDQLTGTDPDYHGLFWWWGNDPASPMVQWLDKQRTLNAAFAGCFSENSKNPDRCFPSMAFRYIFSLGGSKQVTGIPDSAVSHQACFDFKEKSGYDAFALNADIYLKSIAAKPSEKEKKALESIKPDAGSAYKAPKDIKLLDFSGAGPTDYELLPGSNIPIPPALILLAKTNPTLMNFNVNFEEILKKYWGGDRIDNNANGTVDEAAEANTQFFPIDSSGQPNWLQVGEQLFQTPRVDEASPDPKSKPLKFGDGVIPGTKEVVVRITPIPGKTISSLVFHKEPTIDTVEAETYQLDRDANGDFIEDPTLTADQKKQLGQYQAVTKTAPDGTKTKVETRNTSSIPIDSPRYVSFRDSKGNYQKIFYPNAFQAKDLAAYQQQLADLETQLAAIAKNPLYAGSGPASINGYLTGIIDPTFENDVNNTSDQIISIVSGKKLADALQWKGFDLDQKHDYSLRSYWGETKDAFTPLTESPTGYEMLYMNSSGISDGVSMKFNKDIPPAAPKAKVDTPDCSKPANAKDVACADAPAPIVDTPVTDNTIPTLTAEDDSVIIFEWFQAMVDWAKETADIASGKGAVTSCPAGGFTDIPDDPGASAPYNPVVVLGLPVDANGDGLPDNAQKTVKLNLSLQETGKNVLRSGTQEQTKIVVDAWDGSEKLNDADNISEVKLNLKTTSGTAPVIEMVSPDTAQLVNGETIFTLKAGDNPGTVSATATLVGRPKVSSNSLPLVSSAENIRLTAYTRFTTYKFQQGVGSGYTIFDGNGNGIADVDPKTGYITIIDDKYEVTVLPSTGKKPTRLAVVEKVASGAPAADGTPALPKVMAILYFVVDPTKNITLDASNVDYMTKYLDLQNGVHIEDLSASDDYDLQTISDDPALKGQMAIVNKKIPYDNGKVGVIDKRGNIFISSYLKLKQKTGASSASPVVFEVEDADGKPLMDVYLGAKFEVIKELPYEQIKDFFAKLPLTTMFARVDKVLKWSGELRVSALRIAHAANNIPDDDKDGLNNLEEVIIGTNGEKADTNGDGINDLDSLNQGIDPVKVGSKLFVDMNPGDDGYSDVVKLYKRGIFVADPDGKVRPNDAITREEFIKLDLGGICVICDRFTQNIKDSVMSLYAHDPFPDTDIAPQYKYCVAEGKNRGIISGYDAYVNVGYYVPKANITRAEATKVILETSRQQAESFPEFVNEDLTGKPWYYNYVLTAQKEGLYPKGRVPELDSLSAADFKKFFDGEIIKANSGLPGGIENSSFMLWMAQPMTRVEFAIMVSRFVDKYNCFNNDQDGDTLPDNLEKYVYGTNPTDKDTDKGGVYDGVEVYRGTDPLNKADDIDLNADPDHDGLTTGKEQEIGTDPMNPDTDGGGVWDGDELLLGINPLDQGDDKTVGKASGLEDLTAAGAQPGVGDGTGVADGAYISGLQINPKTVYSLPNDGTVDESQVNTEDTDRIPADGVTTIYVKATIYDANGDFKTSDNSSVVHFGFKNADDSKSATLSPIDVKVTNGVAETTLTSKTKTGLPVVIAAIDGQNIPSDEKLIEVYALDPAQASLKVTSPVIPNGGLSSTAIHAQLLDKYGNLTNNGTFSLTFDAVKDDGSGKSESVIDASQDEDKKTDGVQISSVTGEYDVKLISGTDPEKVKVMATYKNAPLETVQADVNNTTADLLNLGAQVFKPSDVVADASVETRNDLSIKLTPDKTELKANAADIAKVKAEVVDSSGAIIPGFEGSISLKLLNKNMGDIILNANDSKSAKAQTQTKQLTDSATNFYVESSRKAGDLEMVANVEGIDPANLKIENYAFKATKLVLDSSVVEVDADPSKVYTIGVKLYDNQDNLVTRDSSTQVQFSIDPESAKFGNLIGASKIKVVNGEATASFSVGTLTGPLRIRAKVPGLLDGSVEISVTKHFNGKDFRDIKPKFLYGDLLGAGYGEVTSKDYFGGWFVFSGKVESAASLITDPKPKKRLAEVQTSGKVTAVSSGDLDVSVIPANAANMPNRQLVTDLASNKEVMEVFSVVKPQSQIQLVTSEDQMEKVKEMVNVMNLATDNTKYVFKADSDKVNITKDGQLIASIGRDSRINLISPALTIGPTDGDLVNINYTISDSGNDLAKVLISTGGLGDVQVLDDNFKYGGEMAPGVYLRKLTTIPNRDYVQSFSGNSTDMPQGYYYTDLTQDLDKNQSPGLDYLSLESADTSSGMGFTGDNKSVLLFSAGSTVGEANLPYASDAGVILGDPTVRIDNRRDPSTLDKLYSATGFTKDIGKVIFTDSKNIKEITPIDYDNDGDKDLFISYADGDIRLLENIDKGKEFQDRGVFLTFPTGILSMTVMDINDDGWDDLVVATADSCKVGEVCVDAYLNNKGNFVRSNLKLEGFSAKNKVYMIRSADMNGDTYPDLITSDDSGSVKVFYTNKGQINLKGQLIGNLGAKINSSDNLKEEVFVNFDGMVGDDASTADDDKYFEKVTVPGDDNADTKEYSFKSVKDDAILGVSSTKNAENLTEKDAVEEGDSVKYTIKLVNSANLELKNLMVADVFSSAVNIDKDTIKCEDCKKDIKIVETGMSLRPYVITGVDMPANSTRTITYSGTVGTLPKIKILVGPKLSNALPVKDDFPDVMATPENNPTGRVVYYYSISKDNSTGQITYGKYVTPDPNAAATNDYKQPVDPKTGKPVGVDLSLFDKKGPDGLPIAVKYYQDYGTFPNMDLNSVVSGSGAPAPTGEGDTISSLPGVGPAYDALSNGLDAAADGIANALGALTCSGGCIPMPINYSFLTPGPINVMGVPGGFDPGMPIFAWGVPSIPPIWPPWPYQASTGGRIYISPTLTAKVALSTCLGPYLIGFGPIPGNCFTIVLPIDPLAGICDAIAGAIEGALGAANNFSSSSDGTMGVSSDGGLANTPTADGKNYTGGFDANSSLGNYGFKASVHTNIRIPGFPSFITDWFDNQTSEIINKLTDLPDIYILLPDVMTAFQGTSGSNIKQALKNITDGSSNVKNEPVSPKGLRGVLAEINKIPIISIVPQEVLIKIPTLTPGEIDLFINDAKMWVDDEKAELKRVLLIWDCTTDKPYKDICDIITGDFTKTIQSVEKNIETIDAYKRIPRQILAWRNMLTKYITQIICYIDAILNFFVGNISKWISQANAWVDAVAKLIETIATWKLMIQLIIDYQADCDTCTTARFSLLELILKLFAFIPSPPIIPFPKLPDIYLDFSQIQMGIKILWPDIKFRPERIVLPRLPRIYLPDLPLFKIVFPPIPLLPDLSIVLPELPDLPPLTLPALPNLPPPPKIPKLPGAIQATISILKKIFFILCLIKKGFIPTPEVVLKPTVEHMTERSLSPLLPFDLGLALQFPPINYEYVDRIVLTTKINLTFDFSAIYDFVQSVADGLNVLTTDFVSAANSASAAAQNAASNVANSANSAMQNAVPTGNAGTAGTTGNTSSPSGNQPLLNYLPKDLTTALQNDPEMSADFAALSPELAGYFSGLNSETQQLAGEAARYRKLIADNYQDIHLKAGSVTIRPSDPIANQSLDQLEQYDVNNTILALGNDFPETKKLAGLRQNLLAFAEENDNLNKQLLGVDDLSQFATMMAQAPTMQDTLIKSGYDSGTMLAQVPSPKYAQTPSLSDVVKNGGLDPKLQDKQTPRGMFIYNADKKENEKLILYEDELSGPTTMNFVDVDNDTDNDLVYSFGGNVFLKENYNVNGSIGKFYGGMPKYFNMEDLVPAAPSVNGFTASFSGNKTLDLKWDKATGRSGGEVTSGDNSGADITGYEVILGQRLGAGVLPGVLGDLNAAGLSKYVFLNSIESTGGALTNSLLQPDANAYNFPVSTLYDMYAQAVSGEVDFDGPQQNVLASGGDKILIKGGQEIYATEDSTVKVWDAGVAKADKKMTAHELITMSPNFGGKLEIQVSSGSVTIIDTAVQVQQQKLVAGSLIDVGLTYKSVNGGSALVKLPKEAYTRVEAGQDLQIKVLDNPDQPESTLQLDNSFYYAVLRSFDVTGFRSTRSESALLDPNICSDRAAPLAVAGPEEKQVAIFKKLNIDASKSFDAFGKVVSYYIDTDVNTDSDGDGDKTNDRNLGRDLDLTTDSDGDGIINDDLNDPNFFLGPYTDLDDKHIMLNVVDESGNTGQQAITIKIYVPKVTLDDSSAHLQINKDNTGSTVSGIIDKPENDIPISVIRDRDGVKTPIITKAADGNGKYFTDDAGKFSLADMNLNDTVVIKNASGEDIAEIDPTTGRIILKDPTYSVEALPAEEPLVPTRVVVKDPSGKIVATVFVVSDANTDVTIDSPDLPYNAGTVAIFKGVHMKDLLAGDLANQFEMRPIPGDAKKYPGGVEIVDKATQVKLAIMDTGGNFYIYDSRLSLQLENTADLKEPMIFDVVFTAADGTKTNIAQFHVAFSTKKPIDILDGNKFKLFVGQPNLHGPKFDTDKDGMPDPWELQYGLNINNAADAKDDEDKDGLTNLDEYRAGTNPLLADSDGDGFPDGFEKAHGKDPNAKATSPFIDVTVDNPYYQSILNFFERGILAGIPTGNSLKFGFDEPIQRAEFAKVMLDTFCIVPRPEAKTGPGVFTDIPYITGQVPWYFAATKEAYFQGFITGYRGQIDVRTGQTPFAPQATITKAEAVKIILEALERVGIISLANVPVVEPYYVPYIQMAEDLTKFIKPGFKLKNNFILTADEAANPEADMNRGEFIKLADRVLSAYDCSVIDDDHDGMPSFWEKQHGLNPLDPRDANQDPDKDGLLNLDEYKNGTDPFDFDTDKGGIGDGEEVLKRLTNPLDPSDDWKDTDGDGLSDQDEVNKYHTNPNVADTDHGGVNDGDEVLKNGTNPLNKLDDLDTDQDGLGDAEETDIYHTDPLNPDTDGGGIKDGAEVYRGTDPLNAKDDLIDPRKDLGEGVYVIQEPCATCPCPSDIEHTADLIPGDKILAVISNNDNSQIFSESNIEEIADVKPKQED